MNLKISSALAPLGGPIVLPPGQLPDRAASRRRRVWDLSPSLHCSVVDTCLTTSDVRYLLRKLNDFAADSADEHRLHARAVNMARRSDVGGKLMTKTLDRRHHRQIRRFARAEDREAVRRLWDEAFAEGDIAGAYWATLTHPATDEDLVHEVFGQVHMLSHLVGRSSRMDIQRLRQLEFELDQRDERIRALEQRVQTLTRERAELSGRIAQAGTELQIEKARTVVVPAACDESLVQRLHRAQARIEALERERGERARALESVHARAEALAETCAALSEDLAAAEAALHSASEKGDSGTRLAGRVLLYIGGRPALVDQLKYRVREDGGALLTHDGGLEDSLGLLPGLVARADSVLFPVDCVSHSAMGLAKRLCNELGKPLLPLRTASVASFLSATRRPGGVRGN